MLLCHSAWRTYSWESFVVSLKRGRESLSDKGHRQSNRCKQTAPNEARPREHSFGNIHSWLGEQEGGPGQGS